MEIGGLRVVASPVRVHWGREGRSEVRVPDGGGEGVSTLTGQRSLQAGPERGTDPASPPAPGPGPAPPRPARPLVRPQGCISVGRASCSPPLPPLAQGRGLFFPEVPGGRLPETQAPPSTPGSATASTAREAPAHRPARLARGRGRDARVGRSRSGTVSGCWAFSWRGHCCFVPRGLLPDPPPCSSYPAPRAPPGACSAVRVSSGLQAALLSDAASLCRVPGGPALCCLC